jgi:Rhodopirellula transposase DDE domain
MVAGPVGQTGLARRHGRQVGAASNAHRRATNTPAALVVRVVGSVRVGREPGGGAAIVTRPGRSRAGWVWSTPGRPAAGPAAGVPRGGRRANRRDQTHAGLKIRAELDRRSYPLGVKISDRDLAAVPLHRHGWHGEWNYTVLPAAA